jgi:hypothetical protein
VCQYILSFFAFPGLFGFFGELITADPLSATIPSEQIVEPDIHDPGCRSVLLTADRHFLLSTP